MYLRTLPNTLPNTLLVKTKRLLILEQGGVRCRVTVSPAQVNLHQLSVTPNRRSIIKKTIKVVGSGSNSSGGQVSVV